jgi:8-oxo-dGTP pyrophosphatase MutT (NUDIX family)
VSDLRATKLLPFEELSRGEPDQRHVFAVRSDRVRSQTSGRELDVDRIVSPNWVNVVAFAEEAGERVLLCVRQWRFGRGSFSLEIPAGIIDPGEEPRAAALRELREETGFAPARDDEVVALGFTEPNPAILTNEQHTFLVKRAVSVGELALDDTEEIEVVKVPVARVDELVREGTLKSAVVLAALLLHRVHDG